MKKTKTTSALSGAHRSQKRGGRRTFCDDLGTGITTKDDLNLRRRVADLIKVRDVRGVDTHLGGASAVSHANDQGGIGNIQEEGTHEGQLDLLPRIFQVIGSDTVSLSFAAAAMGMTEEGLLEKYPPGRIHQFEDGTFWSIEITRPHVTAVRLIKFRYS